MFANILIMISSFAFGFFVGAIWMANGENKKPKQEKVEHRTIEIKVNGKKI